MKINPDHLSAIRPDAKQDAHKSGKTDGSFEDMLSRAAEKTAAQAQPAQNLGQLPGPGAAMHLTATQMLFPLSTSPESKTKAMDTLDNLLLQWENYARQLAAQPQGLRHAHDTLSKISSQIGELKANWSQKGSAAAPGTALRGMLDELEVLAVTERIKFDRGDYV